MWWESCQTVLTTTHFILRFDDLLPIKTLFINFLWIIWPCLNNAHYVSWVIFVVVFWMHIYRLEGLMRIVWGSCVTDAQSVTRKQILIIDLLTVWFGSNCSINIRTHVLKDSVVHIFLKLYFGQRWCLLLRRFRSVFDINVELNILFQLLHSKPLTEVLTLVIVLWQETSQIDLGQILI